MKEMIKMTLKEAERLSVMRQVDKKNLTLRKASEELGLSLRQTKRIRKRYKEGGASIFFHRLEQRSDKSYGIPPGQQQETPLSLQEP